MLEYRQNGKETNIYIYVCRSCVSRIPLWCVSIFFSFFPNSESLYRMSTNCVRYWPTREKRRESITKYPSITPPPFNFVASRTPNTPLYTRLFCPYIYTFLGAGRQKEQKRKKERAVKVSEFSFSTVPPESTTYKHPKNEDKSWAAKVFPGWE